MNKIIFCFLFITLCSINSTFAQQGFYNPDSIQKIEIFFSQTNWDEQLDSLKAIDGGYLKADSIIINGTVIPEVGVKYKGSSSYDPSNAKNPYHIRLDKYNNTSNYDSYTDIKLSNGYQDPSYVREALAYSILSNYMHCSGSNFATLYINNNYIGLYTNSEDVNETFCSHHFLSLKNNTFVKCNPPQTPGPYVKSNLKYISSSIIDYTYFYEMKSDIGWQELVDLTYNIGINTNHAHEFIDLDRVIWMLAFNNLLVNLDSYTGVFAQNYYLFKDNNGIFNPVVWDLNMSFGGFPFVGSSNTSMGSLSVAQMQTLAIDIHANDPYWPLINLVMQDAVLHRKYVAHMKTIAEEHFINNNYISKAMDMRLLIDSNVSADTNGFFSYNQFLIAMDSNISAGSYQIPGISTLINARIAYLQSLSAFTALPPTLSDTLVYATTGAGFITFNIRAENTTQGHVYLGYRASQYDKFNTILMYDDGLHDDAQAGDNLYGITLPISQSGGQYYYYAENDDAGIFMPARAEHEFLSLNPTLFQKIDKTEKQSLNIFYNPNNQSIEIQGNSQYKQEIFVYGIANKIVFASFEELPFSIRVSGWSTGVYVVTVGETTGKIFIP